MPTAADIRNRAAEKLGIFGTGQTPSKKVSAILDQAYIELHAELEARTITTWDFDEPIPDKFAAYIVVLVADSRKDEFRIPNDLYQRLSLEARGDGTPRFPGAIANLRTMQASNVYKTPRADYF